MVSFIYEMQRNTTGSDGSKLSEPQNSDYRIEVTSQGVEGGLPSREGNNGLTVAKDCEDLDGGCGVSLYQCYYLNNIS